MDAHSVGFYLSVSFCLLCAPAGVHFFKNLMLWRTGFVPFSCLLLRPVSTWGWGMFFQFCIESQAMGWTLYCRTNVTENRCSSEKYLYLMLDMGRTCVLVAEGTKSRGPRFEGGFCYFLICESKGFPAPSGLPYSILSQQCSRWVGALHPTCLY